MLGMTKYRLYTIRRQGDQFRHISIHLDRDAVTGEPSICLTGFGNMLRISLVETIPELWGMVSASKKTASREREDRKTEWRRWILSARNASGLMNQDGSFISVSLGK